MPANGDLLVFGAAGAAGTTLNNDISGLRLGTTAASSIAISFSSAAPAYTINGNLINFGLTSGTQTIQNLSTNTQTFGTAFNVNGGVSLTLAGIGSSAMTFNGVLGGTTSADNVNISRDASSSTGTATVNFANTANTYAGITNINANTILNVAALSDYGVNGSLGNRTFASDGGATASSSNGAGLVLLGGTLQYTGSTATSTNRFLRLGANTTNTIDASGTTASATMSFTQSGATGNLFSSGGTRTLNLIGSNTGDNLMALQFVNQSTNATSITKNGAGKWILSNSASAYSGATTITQGTLAVTASSTGAAGSVTAGPVGTGSVTFASAANTQVFQADGADRTINNAIVTNNTNLGSQATPRAAFNANGNNFTIGGVISGSGDIQNVGTTGVLYLTNTASTYSGHLNITAGTVNVANLNNYGVNGALGNRAASSDTSSSVVGLILNGGTLQYTGSSGTAQSTDRMIRLGTTGAIDASGATTADTVAFTASTENNIAAAGSDRTLTLTGSNTGNNTFNGALFDRAGGVTNLTKTGTGTWVYSGSNNATTQAAATAAGSSSTNAGTFTVSVGTLKISGDNSLRTGANSVASGAIIDLQNANALGTGALTASSGSTIILQADASTTFAGNVSNVSAFANASSGATVQNFQINKLTADSTATGNTFSFGVGTTTNTSGGFGQSVTYNVTSDAGNTLALGSIKVNNNSTVIFNPTTANLSVQGITNASTGGITKNGAGTLTITGASTSTGATAVNGGTLLVNGSTASGSAVTVTNNGTLLGGTGTVAGTVAIGASGTAGTTGPAITAGTRGSGGTIAAGDVGTLATGALTLNPTGVFHADIASGSSYDVVNVTGTVTLGGTLELNIAAAQTFTSPLILINNDGTTDAISGTFAGLAQGSVITANGYTFTANYMGGDGNDFELDVTAVPEPATVLSGLLMVGALGWHLRRPLRSFVTPSRQNAVV